ncbi:MAG TPA: UbiA family prenyltransferase, partial [Candidatus Limnocylindrales bacterium]
MIALIAGAGLEVAVRLGLGMLLLQASIGVVNDIVDAPRDAVSKPAKPIPAGLVPPVLAALVGAVAAALGLALSAASGPPTVLVGVLVLGIGYAYDLWLKGTASSWLPFAVGIPLLPVYAWLGAAGSVPPAFTFLLPAAVLAGAALAIANALADAEADRAAGVPSVALALGAARAWRVHAALHVGVAALAVLGLSTLGWRG